MGTTQLIRLTLVPVRQAPTSIPTKQAALRVQKATCALEERARPLLAMRESTSITTAA